jgi:Protein of unknown function (DUF5672)
VLFLTDALPAGLSAPGGVEVRNIGAIASRHDYSGFIMKRLVEHVETSHVLVTQWDGYVVRPEAWRDEFLNWDYIGAVWRQGDKTFGVGNGGFSLRSRRLLNALRDDRFRLTQNEDQDICGHFRPVLEGEFGIRFADEALADAFSFETDPRPWLSGQPVFGFHGIFNLFLTEPQDEIADVAEQLPDDVLRSTFCGLLLSNCLNYKQWNAAIALGTRMLEADPGNERAAELVTAARTFGAAERAKQVAGGPSMASRLFRWAQSRR